MWGRFISKGPRFVAYVYVDGNRERCHLPNPGRMEELLYENCTVLLKRNIGSQYKTKYTIVATTLSDEETKNSHVNLINLNTHVPIPLITHEFIHNKRVDVFRAYRVIKREPVLGNTRFDLLLEDNFGDLVYCELKSTTKVLDRIGYFPDAVSKRAANHVRILSDLASNGTKGLILFIVQTPDAKEVRPDAKVDPIFTKVVREAQKDNLMFLGITTRSWINGSIKQDNDISGTIFFECLNQIPFNPF